VPSELNESTAFDNFTCPKSLELYIITFRQTKLRSCWSAALVDLNLAPPALSGLAFRKKAILTTTIK
jgi:hypothetical protein